MKCIFAFLLLTLLGNVLPAHAESPAQKYIESLTVDIPTVTPEELRAFLETREDEIVLLDVRTFHERSNTRTILGDSEIHIPRGFLEVKAWNTLPRDRTVIVYCSMGTRSKLAIRTLRDMGWDHLYSLEGGVKAWYESLEEDCGCLPEDQEIPSSRLEKQGECKP